MLVMKGLDRTKFSRFHCLTSTAAGPDVRRRRVLRPGSSDQPRTAQLEHEGSRIPWSLRGDPWHRDAAYHMGTVWAWLLGPFARAHFRVYGDARLAQSLLEPIAQHLNAACIGTVSEILMVTHLTVRRAVSRRPGASLRYCAHGFISSARSRRLKEHYANIE